MHSNIIVYCRCFLVRALLLVLGMCLITGESADTSPLVVLRL